MNKKSVSWNDAYINSKNPKKIIHNFNQNGDCNNEWDDLQSQFLKYTK
jgi:hypothetical protein